MMAAPAIVTVTVVTRVMNSDGICAGICRVARSRRRRRPPTTSANSENWLKPASPGRTMMSTPMKPATIAEPAPPADRLAEHHGGAERDRQRQRLEDRRGIGERQVHDRRHERDRSADFAEHPQRHRLHHQRAQRTQRALMPGERRDQRNREQAAHQHHLAEIHLRRHHLGDGVVHGEARHGHGHQQASADVRGRARSFR